MTVAAHEAAATRLLIEIETLRRLVRLYPAGHPSIPNARLRVTRAAEEMAVPALSLAFGPDKIFLDQAEIVISKGSPVIRLRQLLCRLGLAAIHLTFPDALHGLGDFVDHLATLHDPPGEDDRRTLLSEAASFPGIELVPLDLSRVQLLDISDSEDHAGAVPVWAELARQLGHDGAFILADKILSGDLTAQALADLVAQSADPATLFDQLFARLAETVGGLDPARRPAVLSQIGLFLAEWLGLLSPERRHLAVIAATSHFPPDVGPGRCEDPIVQVDLLLDAVEYMLVERLPIPDEIVRTLERLTELTAEDAPWISAPLTARCRSLLVRVSLLAASSGNAPESPVEQDLEPAGDDVDARREYGASLSDDRLRIDLVRLLGEVMTLWPADLVSERASIRLAEELVSSLDLGDLETAARLTSLLSSTRYAEARRVVCHAGVLAAVRAFSTVERSEHGRVSAILLGLGDEAIPAVLEALANEENLSVRKRLLEVVLQHGDRALPAIRPCLDDPRWYVVRNAIFLLRRLGDRSSAAVLKERLAKAEPQLLSEILKNLVAIEDPQWLELLLHELRGGDEERRLAALGVAARIAHPIVIRGIIDQLHAQSGKKLREPYTVELIRALGRLADPAAVPELKRILDLRQWLVPIPLSSLRREAALALARVDSPEAKSILEELSFDRDPEVAGAVRRAVRRTAAARERS